MAEKAKVYIFIALVFMGLMLVPSAVLMDSVSGYYHLLTGWSGGSVLPHKKTAYPVQQPPADEPAEQTTETPDAKVVFTKFSYINPRAKTVSLLAEFNRWDKTISPMKTVSAGQFELELPLAAGSYQYAFSVDGRTIPDPLNPKTARRRGKTVSVKVVE